MEVIRLVKEKECKGSIRYALPPGTTDEEARTKAITNVYVQRAAFPPNGMPAAIDIIVKAAV